MMRELSVVPDVGKIQTQAKILKTDQHLISKCLKGDHLSFKALYERYNRKFFLICYRYMGNQHDAEEVLQEGFIKIYRDLKQYNVGRASFPTWAS